MQKSTPENTKNKAAVQDCLAEVDVVVSITVRRLWYRLVNKMLFIAAQDRYRKTNKIAGLKMQKAA